ncbi:MAG: prephenate dehydrogenase/arogenate dehydrogenase family protein [Planctomycetota bacterium]|nr:prephenate dehydrogenase/arogenate dehydrogenase family protein [Planctomycetota bacterium]
MDRGMITTVAILGYGRFGRAMTERLLEQGCKVVAYDPVAEVPAEIRVANMASTVAAADLVVLAMPISQIRPSLIKLRPTLRPNQIVMDVGSVKSGPAAWMEEILGDVIPWVATHPLFGPVSLARGERPLRVVVCPNRQHPRMVQEVESFLWEMGFDVSSLDPEQHDREMAASHALAFFVAKGFIDANLLLDSEFAPPSVRAIRQTLESVQADAGQLFGTLHRDNPYAGEMRAKLLASLMATDDALREPMGEGDDGGSSGHYEGLHIVEASPIPPQLLLARDLIDEIDTELMQLLARRAELSMRAARAKAEVGKGVRDPKRETDLLHRRRDIADSYGLDPDAVEAVFQSILNFSRRHQSEHLDELS